MLKTKTFTQCHANLEYDLLKSNVDVKLGAGTDVDFKKHGVGMGRLFYTEATYLLQFIDVSVSIRKWSITVLDSNCPSSHAWRHFPGHLDRMLHLPDVHGTGPMYR